MITEGSHRQFTHPTKPGRVTVSGHLGEDMPKVGTFKGSDPIIRVPIIRRTAVGDTPCFLGRPAYRQAFSHQVMSNERRATGANHCNKLSGCSDFVRPVISSSRIHSVMAVSPLTISGLSRAWTRDDRRDAARESTVYPISQDVSLPRLRRFPERVWLSPERTSPERRGPLPPHHHVYASGGRDERGGGGADQGARPFRPSSRAIGAVRERHCERAMLMCVTAERARPDRACLRHQACADRRTPTF